MDLGKFGEYARWITNGNVHRAITFEFDFYDTIPSLSTYAPTWDPTTHPTGEPTSSPTHASWVEHTDPVLPQTARNMAIGYYNIYIYIMYVKYVFYCFLSVYLDMQSIG